MASAGRWAWMAEVAGEELAKLEAAHPGQRLGPLKADLHRLVADPGLDEDDEAAFPLVFVSPRAGADTTPAASSSQPAPAAAAPSCTAVPACTQESSTRKRKPRGGSVREREEVKRSRRASAPTGPGAGGSKDSADMAIERARRCLERIRAVKQSLLSLGFTDGMCRGGETRARRNKEKLWAAMAHGEEKARKGNKEKNITSF